MNGEGEPGGGNGKVPPFPDLLPIEWHGLRSPVGRSFEQAGTGRSGHLGWVGWSERRRSSRMGEE